MSLSGTEQSFVQAMLAAKALSTSKAIDLYNTCAGNVNPKRTTKIRDAEAFQKKIERINAYVNECIVCMFSIRTILV